MDVTINPWSGHISAATALMTAIHVSYMSLTLRIYYLHGTAYIFKLRDLLDGPNRDP